jgi:hypothetical protein
MSVLLHSLTPVNLVLATALVGASIVATRKHLQLSRVRKHSATARAKFGSVLRKLVCARNEAKELDQLKRTVSVLEDNVQSLWTELTQADYRGAMASDLLARAETRFDAIQKELQRVNRLFGAERAQHIATWKIAHANAKDLGEEREGRQQYQRILSELDRLFNATRAELAREKNQRRQLAIYVEILKAAGAIMGHFPN